MTDTKRVTDFDEQVISAIDFALGATEHRIGTDDDHAWFRDQIEHGRSDDKLKTSIDMNVALARLVVDLRAEMAKRETYGYL